jgi:hypothetical protein
MNTSICRSDLLALALVIDATLFHVLWRLAIRISSMSDGWQFRLFPE